MLHAIGHSHFLQRHELISSKRKCAVYTLSRFLNLHKKLPVATCVSVVGYVESMCNCIQRHRIVNMCTV